MLRALLLALLPTLTNTLFEHRSCFCDGDAVQLPGAGCFLYLNNGEVVNIAGCTCTKPGDIPFVANLQIGGEMSAVSCMPPDETTTTPFGDEFLNVTNATTTDLPTTTEWIDKYVPKKSSITPEIPTSSLPPLAQTSTSSAIVRTQLTLKPSEPTLKPTEIIPTNAPEASTAERALPTKGVETPIPPSVVPTKSANDDPVIIIGGDGFGDNGNNTVGGGNETEEEVIKESPHRCNNTEILQSDNRRTVKYMLYFTTGWIVLWCLITIICNLCWENGHHRFINFFQELGIMLLFIVIGTCSLHSFDQQSSCEITSHIIAASVAWIMASFLMEGILANRMVKGRCSRITWCQTIPNALFPFVVAGAIVGAGIGAAQEFYGSANIHCFCSLETKQFWVFILPPWILIVLYSFIVQNSIVSCDLAKNNAHETHLYWGRKSAKSNTVLPLFIFSAYATAMFGADLQLLWLFVVYTVLCVVLGPLIFILHTYCYLKTSAKLVRICRPIYSKCKIKYFCNLPEHTDKPHGKHDEPVKESDQKEDPAEKPKEPVENSVQPTEQPRTTERPDSSPSTDSATLTSPNPRQPSTSQNLYNWLSDRNEWNMRQGEDILFRPRVYE